MATLTKVPFVDLKAQRDSIQAEVDAAVLNVFDKRLKNIVHTPAPAAEAEHIFHLYVIETERRDARREALKQRGVDTGIHYPVPAHLQECVAYLGYKPGTFPVTEAAAGRILSLPMYAELSDAQIDYVCNAVADVLK